MTGCWVASYGSRRGQVASSCEYGNEPLEFHKMQGISWLAEELLASQEGFYSMEFVIHVFFLIWPLPSRLYEQNSSTWNNMPSVNRHLASEFNMPVCKNQSYCCWMLWYRVSELWEVRQSVYSYIQILWQQMVLFYRGADKSLAWPGTKQATATEDFEFHVSYL